MADNYSVQYIFEAIDKMSKNLKTIENNVKGLGNTFGGAGGKAKSFSDKMNAAGNKLKNIGNRMRYMSLAAAGAGAASVIAFSKMEKGIVNVQGLMEQEDILRYTGKMQQLQKQAIKTGFGIEDANKSLFDTVSALGTGDQAMRTFQMSQKLSIGGNAELSTSVDGLTSVINAYGRETTRASDVANAFYSAQVFGKTTVAELASNVGKVAPIAKVAGVGFKELLSTMSAVTLGGLSTDEATTALRGALSALVKPGSQARQILDKLGIAHGRTKIKAVGFKNVLWQIIKAGKEHPKALDAAIPNIRAFTGLMTLSADKLAIVDKAMKKINKDIKNNTGLQDAYNRMMKTTSQQLNMLRGNLSIIGDIIGTELAPYVAKLNIGFIKFTQFLQSMNPATRRLVIGLGALVAVLAPLMVTLGYVAIGLSALTIPMLIIAAKVVIIGTAIAALIIYWDDLINAMKEAYSWLVNFGEKLSGGLFRFDPLGIASQKIKVDTTAKTISEHTPTQNEFFGKLDVNLNAPKGTVKNYTSVAKGAGFNLGVNMGF